MNGTPAAPITATNGNIHIGSTFAGANTISINTPYSFVISASGDFISLNSTGDMTLNNALTFTTSTNGSVTVQSQNGTVTANASNTYTLGSGSNVYYDAGTAVVFAAGTTQNVGSNGSLEVGSPQVTLATGTGGGAVLSAGGTVTIEPYTTGAMTLTNNGTITGGGNVNIWAPGGALVMNGTPAAAITSTGGSINVGLGGSSLPSTTTLSTAYSLAATTSGQSVNIESSGALAVNAALTVNSPTANIISTGSTVTTTAASTFNGGSGATVNFSGNGVSLNNVTAAAEAVNVISVGSIQLEFLILTPLIVLPVEALH